MLKGKLLEAKPMTGYELKDHNGSLYKLTIETRFLKRKVEVISLVGYHVDVLSMIGKMVVV